MGSYLKKFETHTQYGNYIKGNNVMLPNVSICITEGDVHYNPYVEYVETRVIAKYNVTSASSPTNIVNNEYISGFSAIEIDGVVQPSVVSAYKFDTLGEHTVKYTLTDPTSIGAYAFDTCDKLVSIDIPNSVTSIGDGAFAQCSFTSIVIPSSVTSLGEYTFFNDHYLESFTIMATTPPSMDSIFGGEMYTPTIYVPSASVEAYKAAEGWSYYEDAIEPIPIPSTPTETKLIAKYYVENGDDWETLFHFVVGSGSGSGSGGEIPFSSMEIDGIEQSEIVNTYKFDIGGEHTVKYTLTDPTSIGDGDTFFDCYSLTSIYIPSGVTSICDSAFFNCNSLTSIYIPNSVTSIGDYAFGICTSLTSIDIPDSVTSIGINAFQDCSGLTSIDIPDSVTSIGRGAFYRCSSLTRLNSVSNGVFNWPNGITSIGYETFRECSSLTSIAIPSGVTSIGTYAFCGCTSLISIDIPNSVTSIGLGAFSGCSILTIIAIPSGVTSIDEGTFRECSSLTSINIPNSVTSIGLGAFDKCSSLTNCTIGSGVTSISDYAFNKCYSLAGINIPDSVTSIGGNAFYGCTSLISVVIGTGVTSIGLNAFNGCSSLASIVCNTTTAPTIQSNTFQAVKIDGTLTVPAGSTGYDVWMGTSNYYLGKYNWTKVEQ